MPQDHPPLKLTQSPLVRVLCQVRFLPIASMRKTYIERIQDKLRLKGYPGYSSASTQQIAFGPSGPVTHKSERWLMHDRTRTSVIGLTSDFVVLETAAYTSFDEFSQKLNQILSTLVEEVQQLVVQRVGLRYVNLVRPSKEKTWQSYLRPGMRGLDSADVLKEGTQLQLIQSVAKTQSGTVIVRIHQNRKGALLPPDLDADNLELNLSPPQPDELLTHVDLDHFSTEQFDFNAERFSLIVQRLHDDLEHLFVKSVVTAEALQEWT